MRNRAAATCRLPVESCSVERGLYNFYFTPVCIEFIGYYQGRTAVQTAPEYAGGM